MSVSNLSRRRGTILDDIVSYHRNQLPAAMREVPLADLRALATIAPPTTDLEAALKRPGVSLIAECKKASPSKGLLLPGYDPVELASIYQRAGASAISVLTDARFFQGSLSDLRDVKEMLQSSARPASATAVDSTVLPVLRKDFIFHPYQLYEARAAGADAVLLIAAILEGGELAMLLNLAHELTMKALVEVHSGEELERVLEHEIHIVGINNRNLQTFEVDFENTARLRKKIPNHVAIVAESGIQSAGDVRRMVDLGLDAILVGESLVRSKDVFAKVSNLVQAGRES